MSKRMEEEGHTDSGKGLPEEHTKERIVCPVCGKVLYEDNLVDVKSIVEDNLYYVGGVLIKNYTVLLHCDFEHCFEERDITIDDPHELIAVVSAEFDGSGECVQFEIVEVLPG